MTIYSGFLMTGIPVNEEVDLLNITSSATSSGVFVLEDTIEYNYPSNLSEYLIDSDLFYKVQFENSVDGYTTPYSDATAGSAILASAPVLEVSSSNDGSPFASVQDVYDRANLTAEDISEPDIRYALSVARAYIDMRLSSISLDRYRDFGSSVQTRKYNALLRLIKDSEMNYALSLVYKHMADDKIMENATGGKKTSTSISVGQTAINGIQGADSIEVATFFDALSARYATYAANLLDTLTPNYVPLRYSENGTGYDTGYNQLISFSNGSASFDFAAGIILDRMEL